MTTTVQQAIYEAQVRGREQLDQLATSLGVVARAEEQVTAATTTSERAFERMIGKLDPGIRANQQYQATLERIARYEQAGIGTAQQRDLALQLATKRYTDATKALGGAAIANDNFAKATGLSTFAVSNLGFQLNDIATGLASGGSPFQIMAQRGGQLYQILQMSDRGVGGALRGIKDQILAFLTPGRMMVLVFAAAAAAGYGLYRLLHTEGPTAEKTLEEQARILGVLKHAYTETAFAAGKFHEQSKAITQLQVQQSLLQLQQLLKQTSEAVTQSLTTPTSLGSASEFVMPPGFDQFINDAKVANTEYRELNKVINDFVASTRGWKDVMAFRDAVAAIGVAARETNPALAKQANDLLVNTKALADLALATQKAEAMQRLLGGTATKTDRELLGVAVKAQVNAYDQLIQRTRDRISELQEEAKYAGQAGSAVAQLKLQHEAERAAKQAGVKVNQQVLDQLKEELALAERKRNLANIRADLEFQRLSLGYSDEDVAIAEKLRVLYGNDIPAALASAEAAQMRFINSAKQLRDLFVDPIVNGLVEINTALMQGNLNWNTLRQIASRALASMSNDIIRMMGNKLIQQFIATILAAFFPTELPGWGTSSFVGPVKAPAGAPAPPVAAATNRIERTVMMAAANQNSPRGYAGVPKIVIEDHAGVEFVPKYATRDEVRIMARQIADSRDAENVPKIVAGELSQPNSRSSKAMQGNFKVERKR